MSYVWAALWVWGAGFAVKLLIDHYRGLPADKPRAQLIWRGLIWPVWFWCFARRAWLLIRS